MTGRLNSVLGLAAAALLAAPFLTPSAALQAQTDYRVLIVDFLATDAQDRGFGERTANELRKLIAETPGYTVIERGEIQDELRKYNLKIEEMDCAKVQQLGSPALMGARVAFCVKYASQGENRKIEDIEVWDLENHQSFPIPGFTMGRNQQKEAAAQIFTGFDTFIKLLSFTTYCAQYAQSQSWEDALRNCDQALALNANSVATQYMRAGILKEMNRHAEALAAAEKVVELDAVHEDALQLAGWLATQLDQNEKGRTFYRRYLELNPGDAGVRNSIAYAMFEAGDPEGAMQFVEEGITASNNDVALLTAHAIYAFQAADKEAQAVQAENSSGATTVSPKIADLYRKAAGSFEKVFAAKGDSTDVAYLRNTVTAYIQLQEWPKAIQLSETFMTAYPQDVELTSRYARALEGAGRIDDALAALRKIESVDPAYNGLYPRIAVMLLNANRVEEAIPALREAVNKGANANAMARVLLGPVTNAMKTGSEDWAYAIRILEQAKEFPVTPEQMQEFDFYHGYAIFQRTVAMQPPQSENKPPSPEVACASRPNFQRARTMLVNSRPWATQNNMGNNVTQLISATDRYFEIIDAVVKRAGGSCPS